VRAAWLYYIEGLTPEEVARVMAVSRAKVIRVLAAARDHGMVRLRIEAKGSDQLALERRLVGWSRSDSKIWRRAPKIVAAGGRHKVQAIRAVLKARRPRGDRGDHARNCRCAAIKRNPTPARRAVARCIRRGRIRSRPCPRRPAYAICYATRSGRCKTARLRRPCSCTARERISDFLPQTMFA